MHPRTTRRRRRATAAALTGVLLAGCAGPGAPGDPAGSPAPTATAPSVTGPSATGPSATAASPTAAPSTPRASIPPARGRWGAYADRAEACAAVAEDLLALALLPASLSGAPGAEQVQAVEDEIAGMLAAAPPELTADLSRVQLLVDSYSEELAEDPGARLDGAALDEALAPVRDWLDETCRDAR